MNNKKYAAAILCIILILAVGGAGVVAYMFRETDETDDTVPTARVSCDVSETLAGNAKSEITVKNTGNIEAYIRVRLVAYWTDEQGNRAYRTASVPSFDYDASAWLADAENDTYYYRTRVAAGTSTENLLGSQIVLARDGEYFLTVEVFAEAIQAAPSDAAASAWSLEIDSSGKITAKK